MAQVSHFWGGTTIGDCGPYSFDEYNHPFYVLLSNGSPDAGIAVRFLNQLVGTTTGIVSGGLTIGTGAALVRGIWYYNSAAKVHTITEIVTPGDWERTDLVVLRANWTTQVVRQVVKLGAEYPLGSPNVPPALTQVYGDVWEIPLYDMNVTSGEDVSLSDRRRFSIAQHFAKSLVAKFIFGRAAS